MTDTLILILRPRPCSRIVISGHRILHESTEIWVQMANKWQTDAGGLPFHVSESKES